jgi:hypothetical protein
MRRKKTDSMIVSVQIRDGDEKESEGQRQKKERERERKRKRLTLSSYQRHISAARYVNLIYREDDVSVSQTMRSTHCCNSRRIDHYH